MSVALMVTGKNDRSVDIFMPIASQSGYRDYCLPIAAKLNLQWLPLFETGWSVPPDDVNDVASEFERLRDEIIASDPQGTEFVARLNRIIETLRSYAGRGDVEVSIG